MNVQAVHYFNLFYW